MEMDKSERIMAMYLATLLIAYAIFMAATCTMKNDAAHLQMYKAQEVERRAELKRGD